MGTFGEMRFWKVVVRKVGHLVDVAAHVHPAKSWPGHPLPLPMTMFWEGFSSMKRLSGRGLPESLIKIAI
ncbi:MAG: hypothetical protein C0478_18040 [Planctomyces sp.]|nr:hypothetical protein [Planctomyces sp.]